MLGRLKSKETAIADWEFKHTSKAMEEMKKIEVRNCFVGCLILEFAFLT